MELQINLLHFGYNPNDPEQQKKLSLQKASTFYTFNTILKKLLQFEKEYGYDLAKDKQILNELEIASRVPPPLPKPWETAMGMIMAIGEKNERMKTFPYLIKLAKLEDYIANAEAITVFYPVDDAFKKFSSETMQQLEDTPKMAQTLVLNHILTPQVILKGKIQQDLVFQAKSGKKLDIKKKNDVLYVNTISVPATDILASNGVIHVLDGLL